MNKHAVWGNKWIIIGQLGLILLVLIGLILLAYFMGRKYITPSTENFVDTIDPDIKMVESQIILDENAFFQSFGFVKEGKYMLINTLLKGTTIPGWSVRPNLKYILDYGIGIPAPTDNGYYLLTFENKPLSNKFYGITVPLSCSIGVKPAETIQSGRTYYFPGYTFTYYQYTKANDDKYRALLSVYSAMMRKYTNGSNFLNGGKNLINLQAPSASGNKIIDISYYSSTKQTPQNIILSAKISGNNPEIIDIIPILIDEQYLAPDNNPAQYVEVTDDGGTGGDVDHSIHANKTTGNIIPIVGANNSYLKNYFQSSTSSTPSVKSFYNWSFTNKKMTDYLGLVLYPETEKYTWTELPGCYWLTISDSTRQFINEVISVDPNTKKNISSIVITDNPETSFRVYKSSYTDPVSKNQVPIYKYVSANTSRILCVQVCNDARKTPNPANLLYLEDVVKDKIQPIDLNTTRITELNSTRITELNTTGLWHNLRKPWHIFESNKLFGALSGITGKTPIITSIKSSSPIQRQLVCNIENLDALYDAKPLSAFFNYQITPPVPTDGNVIQNLYTFPGYNTYFKIISHTLKIGNISVKYFKISTYTNDSLTNNKVFHPAQPQVSNANIYFLPYKTSVDILLYKKYYAFASNCILTYTIPSQLDSTNTDYTKFTQYTRVDPITNYILDTTNKYSINGFGSLKFVKRTAGSYSIFETEDGTQFVILNITTNNFELISKTGINIETRGTIFNDTGFIYYKYNLRFREIDSTRYGLFEFPLESKAISSKVLSVTKLLDTTTTQQTTTTEPTTTQQTTTTEPTTTQQTTTTEPTTTQQTTTTEPTTTQQTITVPTTTQQTITTEPTTTQQTITTEPTTTQQTTTRQTTTEPTTTEPIKTTEMTTKPTTTTMPTTTQGITRATNVFGYATVPIQIR